MRLERVSVEVADELAAALTEKRVLEGQYNLTLQPGFSDRYHLVSPGKRGEYTCMTGVDAKRGRITLLRNHVQAVLLLDATARPLEP